MSKISIEQVEATLLEKKIEQPVVASIIKDLNQALKEEADARAANKLPKQKWEHLIFLNQDTVSDSPIKDEPEGWVVTYKEGVDANTVLQSIRDAAKEQNDSAKNKKATLDNLGEVFQNLKPKFLSGKNIKIKTKESVRTIKINGKSF